MSDGPHKSLGMRPGWKKFAKRGDHAAYERDQVAEALPDALGDDWSAGRCNKLIAEIRAVLGDGRQTQLFENKESRLEALKKVTGAGYPLRRMLLDNIEQAVESGLATNDAILEGTKNTLQDRSLRGIREVEEHFQRKSTDKRAAKVRSRMEDGVAHTSMDTLARRLLKMDSPTTSPSPAKRDGLDEGVRL
jgi:hypothetical protein